MQATTWALSVLLLDAEVVKQGHACYLNHGADGFSPTHQFLDRKQNMLTSTMCSFMNL
jgi:hypothetical protein